MTELQAGLLIAVAAPMLVAFGYWLGRFVPDPKQKKQIKRDRSDPARWGAGYTRTSVDGAPKR